jgi:Kinesin-associated protein (KAP)
MSHFFNFQIGSLCMDVIDYELKRYEQMKNDLEVRRNPEANKLKDQTLNKSHEGLFDTIMNEEKPREMEPPRRRIPELKQRPKSGNWSSYHGGVMSSSLTKAHSMNNSYHENLAKETANGSTETLQSNNGSVDEKLDESKTDPRKQKDEYDKQNKQLKLFAKKQEQLLRVAFYLLLNIAENVKLEEKMRRKNIIGMLVKAVERQNIDLLVLIVTFLKKLSIVRDNKDEMHELMIVDKLPMLLHSSHPDLIQVTLKLLYNLSFDGKLRARMVRVGILPKLVTFLSDDKHHGIVTKILYHLSLDDKVKSMFFYTDCIPIVTDMLLLNLNQKSELDLVGLGINLALNKGNAQLMVENNRLHSMMARAFKFQDALLMKMIRNIAQHEALRSHFIVSF